MRQSWVGLSLALVVLGGGAVRCAGDAGSAGSAAEPAEMVLDGGFESGDTAGIGRNWINESYGAATVQFDRAADKVQFGKFCQHIRVEERKDTGLAQICQLGLSIRKGQPYTIVLWMRGNPSAPVLVRLRKHEAPYTSYVRQEVHVTPAWQRYTISGVATESDANAGLFLGYSGSGELWIDNVSLRAAPGSP